MNTVTGRHAVTADVRHDLSLSDAWRRHRCTDAESPLAASAYPESESDELLLASSRWARDDEENAAR